MDIMPIVALVVSFGLILGGNSLEGGHLSALMQPTAALIVFGGTIGATLLASTNDELKLLVTMLKRVVFPGKANRRKLLDDMVKVSTVVRRDGMLAVEGMLDEIENEFFKRGLRMLVDGASGEEIRSVLESELDLDEHHRTNAGKVLETAGGFAPTVGILGAVLGLIHVMQNLSDPSKLGGGIAVAFVATIYGVGLANLVLIPLGTRIKKIAASDAETQQMVLSGLLGIASGVNARRIEDMLGSYMDHVEAKEAA